MLKYVHWYTNDIPQEIRGQIWQHWQVLYHKYKGGQKGDLMDFQIDQVLGDAQERTESKVIGPSFFKMSYSACQR